MLDVVSSSVGGATVGLFGAQIVLFGLSEAFGLSLIGLAGAFLTSVVAAWSTVRAKRAEGQASITHTTVTALIDQLQEEMKRLKDERDRMDDVITQLRADRDDARGEIHLLKAKVEVQRLEIDRLEAEITRLLGLLGDRP